MEETKKIWRICVRNKIKYFSLNKVVYCSVLFATNIYLRIFCHDIGVIWVDYYSPTYAKFVYAIFAKFQNVCDGVILSILNLKMVIKPFLLPTDAKSLAWNWTVTSDHWFIKLT